jgi:transcriptional regulator with XRE-family HTH domain
MDRKYYKSLYQNRVREARLKALIVSAKELADKIGCTKQAISCWENQKAQPSKAFIQKIAEATNQTFEFVKGEKVRDSMTVSEYEWRQKHNLSK